MDRIPAPVISKLVLPVVPVADPLKIPATEWLAFTVTVKLPNPLLPAEKAAALPSTNGTGVAVCADVVDHTLPSHVPFGEPDTVSPVGSQ
jgi:hypothetical protein